LTQEPGFESFCQTFVMNVDYKAYLTQYLTYMYNIHVSTRW